MYAEFDSLAEHYNPLMLRKPTRRLSSKVTPEDAALPRQDDNDKKREASEHSDVAEPLHKKGKTSDHPVDAVGLLQTLPEPGEVSLEAAEAAEKNLCLQSCLSSEKRQKKI